MTKKRIPEPYTNSIEALVLPAESHRQVRNVFHQITTSTVTAAS
jgi:hypothetical protein